MAFYGMELLKRTLDESTPRNHHRRPDQALELALHDARGLHLCASAPAVLASIRGDWVEALVRYIACWQPRTVYPTKPGVPVAPGCKSAIFSWW